MEFSFAFSVGEHGPYLSLRHVCCGGLCIVLLISAAFVARLGFDSLHKLSLFKDCIPLGILVFGQVLGECFSVNEGMTSAFSW